MHDITRVAEILAIVMLNDFPSNSHICDVLGIAAHDIDVALVDLTSVVSHDEDLDTITFLHASLPDFLLDQSRAQAYYIDRGIYCEQFAVSYLENRTNCKWASWSIRPNVS